MKHTDSGNDSDTDIEMQEPSNIVSKELQKEYDYYQKQSFAGLYVASGWGWILGCALVAPGEFQKPVINLVVKLISDNFKCSIVLKEFMQMRGDGTRRNKNIMKKIFEKLIKLHENCNGGSLIHHTADKNDQYDKNQKNFTYNILTWKIDELFGV